MLLHEDEQSRSSAAGERLLSHMPRYIYVKFEDAQWQPPGTAECGICLFKSRQQTWFLDAYRKKPLLAIHRIQIQLAAAFGSTAHAGQGQTLGAVIADLQEGRGVSTLASYVAITRVRTRDDLLIFRPFPRSLYCKGAEEGPTLLLQTPRGEAVNWE